MKTGENIDNLAKKKKINLHKLSEIADIPYNTLYSIVRRKSDKIDLDTVRKIALALDAHPLEILGDEVLNWIDYGMEIYKRASTESDDFTDLDNKYRLDAAIREKYNIKGEYRIIDIESVGNEENLNQLFTIIFELNEKGFKKASEYVKDLAGNPEYRRTEQEENEKGNIPTESKKPPEGEK